MTNRSDVSLAMVLSPHLLRFGGLNFDVVHRLNPGVSVDWITYFQPETQPSKQARHRILKLRRAEFGLDRSWPSTKEERAEAAAYVKEVLGAAADPGGPQDYLGGARIIDGRERRFAIKEIYKTFPDKPKTQNRYIDNFGAYLQGQGLAACMAAASTRFVILMDPDFYVVQQGWIERVLQNMRTRDLSVFGAPLNPRWHQRARDFPSTQFMVIDCDKVGPSPDLFLAECDKEPPFVAATAANLLAILHGKSTPEQRRSARLSFLRNAHRMPLEDIRQRRSIGALPEPGEKFRSAVLDGSIGSVELATPVFDPDTEVFQPDSVPRLFRARWIENLVSRRFRYLPPRSRYSTAGFVAKGYPNFRSLGWEEFMLDGEPFAFSIGAELRRDSNYRVDPYPAWLGLSTIIERYGLEPPQWDDPDEFRINSVLNECNAAQA